MADRSPTQPRAEEEVRSHLVHLLIGAGQVLYVFLLAVSVLWPVLLLDRFLRAEAEARWGTDTADAAAIGAYALWTGLLVAAGLGAPPDAHRDPLWWPAFVVYRILFGPLERFAVAIGFLRRADRPPSLRALRLRGPRCWLCGLVVAPIAGVVGVVDLLWRFFLLLVAVWPVPLGFAAILAGIHFAAPRLGPGARIGLVAFGYTADITWLAVGTLFLRNRAAALASSDANGTLRRIARFHHELPERGRLWCPAAWVLALARAICPRP